MKQSALKSSKSILRSTLRRSQASNSSLARQHTSQHSHGTTAMAVSGAFVMAATIGAVQSEEIEATTYESGTANATLGGGGIDGFTLLSDINRSLLEAFPNVTFPFSSKVSADSISDRLHYHAEKDTLESHFKVNWRKPLGEGTFGAVFLGTKRGTGEKVAVKKIPKKFTDNATFKREIGALLEIRRNGGHPNICAMQENFEEGEFFYLVLDLISGGEMFDHLCRKGSYSEADAARLIREVASAMNFLHGIGIVHGDMKPENLMLSSHRAADAVIKVVDFGCAQVEEHREDNTLHTVRRGTATTPAYTPPEILKERRDRQEKKKNGKKRAKTVIEPSFDMWSVGVILYIMLTGVHPFDLYGNATDEEIEDQVLSGKRPPLGKSPLTAHLSPDAVKVIEKLLQWDPSKRITAHELLEDPWVRGETALTKKMAGSDKRLNAYRAYKTKLEAKVFADMVSLSDDMGADITKKTSLIERSFRLFDPDRRGYIQAKELRKLVKDQRAGDVQSDVVIEDNEALSLSGFSDILSANMRNKYFPKGHVVYNEGEIGNAMYFLNSGSIEVYTKDGLNRQVRASGDFFGEGALLHPKKIRSASIKCLTPVHAIEISREYFEKYLATDEGVKLNLREKDKARKRQRAKTMLRLQQDMQERHYTKGDVLFKEGDDGRELYIVESGHVTLNVKGKVMTDLHEGEMTGEHSLVFGRPRNVSAVCESEECKVFALPALDFYILMDSQQSLKESVRDICLRREFQKSICAMTGKRFPKSGKELREVFHLVDTGRTGFIELDQLRKVLLNFDQSYTEEDVLDILHALDLDQTGKVSWSEFKRMFDQSNQGN